MSEPVRRLLFDECIGKPVMRQLLPLVSPNLEVHHLVDKFAQGEKDEDWIPRLGIEGGWVLITSDAGIYSKSGQKLPDLCAEHKVTHIILSGKLHKKTTVEKITWIAAAWPFVEEVFSKPPGSRFRMRLKTPKGKTGMTIVVEPMPIKTMIERQHEKLARRFRTRKKPE